MRILLVMMIAAAAAAADFHELAQNGSALQATFPASELEKGTAWLSDHDSIFFALASEKTPTLVIDDEQKPAMTRVNGGNLWTAVVHLTAGRSHAFHYLIAGEKFGGADIPVFLPDSYQQPGVPQGKLSEKFERVSKIYEGVHYGYWIYVPAQYDPAKPAALMVWQDGETRVVRDERRTLNVIDHLIYQKKIPVMIQVFVAPGMVPGAGIRNREIRSLEYDTVDDTYARFLRDEVLPEVQAKYNIRRDAYSRAIGGESAGAICSFNAAWQHPEEFSRVLSLIGSYTGIRWEAAGEVPGGAIYPNKVRIEDKRNIRVWLQDGSEDLENLSGSWPLQNIQMANSLKMNNYDFHFSWGNSGHDTAQGDAELPISLAWLWRDYDPARTQQTYKMEASEAAQPLFRVTISNRK